MKKRKFCIALGLLAAFMLWTIAISLIDVQPIGPQGSIVGFATLNSFVHNLTGTHMTLYTITDWLGLVPVAFGFGFAILGLVQRVKRRSILKVDRSILILGGFYIATLAAYLFFESYVVNYRPVLIEGYLEASYPSSTTLLVLCVMPTVVFQSRRRIHHRITIHMIKIMTALFSVMMVMCRLISGVHWLSDIVGACLLSYSLYSLYRAAVEYCDKKE